MKIAILASGYPPDIRGGGEFSSQTIAESLQRAGAEVHVLACGRADETYVENDVRIRKIISPNVFWSFQDPGSRVKTALWHAGENFNPVAHTAITKFAQAVQPDIFLTSTIENFGAESWRAPVALGIKTVHILRSYYPFCIRATAFRDGHNCASICASCRVGSIGRRLASQVVDGIIGLSRVTLDRHLEHGLFRNAARTVIPDPVETTRRPLEARTLARAPVLGYLGFLTPNKGIELIADALRANATLASTEVLIAGTGDVAYVEQLKARFVGLNVKFLGWIGSEDFLKQVDFLVVPSVFQEPFGRIVVEAFAAAVPVIGSKTGGIGEMVAPSINGFTFEPGKAESLAAAIGEAMQAGPERYAALSRHALDDADNYTGARIARLNLDFFADILSGRAGRGQEWTGR